MEMKKLIEEMEFLFSLTEEPCPPFLCFLRGNH